MDLRLAFYRRPFFWFALGAAAAILAAYAFRLEPLPFAALALAGTALLLARIREAGAALGVAALFRARLPRPAARRSSALGPRHPRAPLQQARAILIVNRTHKPLNPVPGGTPSR